MIENRSKKRVRKRTFFYLHFFRIYGFFIKYMLTFVRIRSTLKLIKINIVNI